MRPQARAVSTPDTLRAPLLLLVAMLLLGCAGTSVTASPVATPGLAPNAAASPTAEGNPSPEATPTTTDGVGLAGLPTVCLGLGEEDCTRVGAHVAALLTATDPRVDYVQIGPFGCPGVQGCPQTLAARPEGEAILEFAGGAVSFHVTSGGGILEAERQGVFGIDLAPSSRPPVPGAPQPFTLGHCGVFSGIDVGGSWWDPVGVVDYDHPDVINAADGTFAPLDPDHALFTSKGGLTLQLIRRLGPKFLPLCD